MPDEFEGDRAGARFWGAASDVARPIAVLEDGTHSPRQCLVTAFEEGFSHHRDALRRPVRLDASP